MLSDDDDDDDDYDDNDDFNCHENGIIADSSRFINVSV